MLSTKMFHRMMTAALALADTIGQMSPCGVQNTKLNLNYARDHTLEDSLDFAVSGSYEMTQRTKNFLALTYLPANTIMATIVSYTSRSLHIWKSKNVTRPL